MPPVLPVILFLTDWKTARLVGSRSPCVTDLAFPRFSPPPPLPPGNIHLLLSMDFSFPSPSLVDAALLPKLFPLESMSSPHTRHYYLIDRCHYAKPSRYGQSAGSISKRFSMPAPRPTLTIP